VTSVDGWDGLDVTVAEVVDRLAVQRRPPGGGAPYLLTGVLNLVAYAAGHEELAAMQDVIEELGDHQPSRTILVVEGSGSHGMDAAVSTSCRMGRDRAPMAIELVVLTVHGEAREGKASVCMPLLRSELPTVLWWPMPPDEDGSLAGLAALADRVVTEVERGPDAAAAVRALADRLTEHGPAVTDLAWAAITPWRQLIVQVLDADALEALRSRAAVAIVHSAPHSDAGALLMAGWLRDFLGPAAAIELRPAEVHGAGLHAVEIAGPSGRHMRVERLPGRDAATVTVTEPDGTVRGRTLPLPDHGRARLLAGELEIQRRDRAFERALAKATG
jgi:glucose-6-phosphate dehydrogenase assembly protein OpcA